MLACFGLLFIIQNLAIMIWGADMKGYSYWPPPSISREPNSPPTAWLTLGLRPGVLHCFLSVFVPDPNGKGHQGRGPGLGGGGPHGSEHKPRAGHVFRLRRPDGRPGGTLISMSYNIQPTMGLEYTMIALIVIVLGGWAA
jgi:branched-chain amino acid transport system permease protein